MAPICALVATTVEIEDDGAILSVSFGDTRQDPPEYILLQAATEATEQDVKSSTDGLYIEMDDQCRSTYHGVRQIEVWRTGIRIHLNANGCKVLGGANLLVVLFKLGDEDFGKLRRLLPRMCGEQVILATLEYDPGP